MADLPGPMINPHSEQVAGIWLDREIKINANWRDLFAGVGDAAASSALKGPLDAIAGGISALVKFALSIKREVSPGEQAHYLTVLSFAWSASKAEFNTSSGSFEYNNLVKEALAHCKDELDANRIFIPLDFIQRPTRLPLYRCLRNALCKELNRYVGDPQSTAAGFKLDAAFGTALHAIWTTRPELCQLVTESLTAVGALSSEHNLSWSAYRARLIYDFEVRPAFGQEEMNLSLSQLYVPLRATWRKSETPDEGFAGAPSPGSHHIALIDDLLSDWLSSNDHSDWLRIIGGGPGSGKSTTLKAFARKVAELPHWQPFFIPLQHIDLQLDLRDSINTLLSEAVDSPFQQPPLTRPGVEDGPPICLIFDGLDEIVAPGEAAREVMGDFANRLSRLMALLNPSGDRKIKVLVSGRLPAFQAAKKHLNPRLEAGLEAYGYTKYPHGTRRDSSDLWNVDQRVEWWAKYASLTGRDTATPEALKSDRLADLTREPLLCYLLALSGYAASHWELAADNRNRIYSALINSVYDRGWGDGVTKRQGAGRSLSRKDFHKLMETIALAAWLGGDARVASEENFERAVKITAATDAWQLFKDENGPDVANLAMNFYIKSSEVKQRGFEFTHKSFGEYLASKALVGIFTEVAGEAERRPENSLRDWYRATNTGLVSIEMLSFLADEFRLQLHEGRSLNYTDFSNVIRAAVHKLVIQVDKEGFPPEFERTSWRVLDSMQLRSERALWAIMFTSAKALHELGHHADAVNNLKWSNPDHLARIIRRLSVNDTSGSFMSCLGFIDAKKQSFIDLNMRGVNLSHAVLHDVVFAMVQITQGSMLGADLTDARFFSSIVREVSFEECILENVTLHGTSLIDCIFDSDPKGSIVASPISLISMNTSNAQSIEKIANLLISSSDTKKEIKGIIASRLSLIDRISTKKVSNLVTDWSEMEQSYDDDEDNIGK